MVLSNWAGGLAPPQMALFARISKGPQNNTYNNDSHSDDLFAKFNSAKTLDEVKKLSSEMDRYALEQHWSAVICPTNTALVWQPWIKDYSGEMGMMGGTVDVYYAKLWIDPNARE